MDLFAEKTNRQETFRMCHHQRAFISSEGFTSVRIFLNETLKQRGSSYIEERNSIEDNSLSEVFHTINNSNNNELAL